MRSCLPAYALVLVAALVATPNASALTREITEVAARSVPPTLADEATATEHACAQGADGCRTGLDAFLAAREDAFAPLTHWLGTHASGDLAGELAGDAAAFATGFPDFAGEFAAGLVRVAHDVVRVITG